MKIMTRETPKWAKIVNKTNKYLTLDLFGGPKLIKMAWVINIHKFLTGFFVLLLMNCYNNFSRAAFIYLALHGSYGFIWVLKHFAFRDKKWETKTTFAGVAFIFIFLSTYWIAPFILISNIFKTNVEFISGSTEVFIIAMYSLGLVIMVASDCQKNITLKYKKGLITDGMFRYIRHPNYLGEMMIYGSFALLVDHWIPWVILAYWWIMVFLVNMLAIESSLSRFPEWEEYRSKTGMLLPLKIFKKRIKNER